MKFRRSVCPAPMPEMFKLKYCEVCGRCLGPLGWELCQACRTFVELVAETLAFHSTLTRSEAYSRTVQRLKAANLVEGMQ